MKIFFDKQVCNDFTTAIEKEWLETNGIGGYASSTILGANTRRYHGLLTVSARPSLNRILLLSKLEETLFVNDQTYEFSCNQYPGTVYPQGYQYLEQFRLDPFPTFTYRFVLSDSVSVTLEKTIAMIHGEDTTLIRYTLSGTSGDSSAGLNCRLLLRPLIAFRDHHSLTHENPVLNPHIEVQGDSIRMRPYEVHPDLYLTYSHGGYTHQPTWYRNFEYLMELKRGLDYQEDLFSPGYVTIPLSLPHEVYVVAFSIPSTGSGQTPYTAEYAEELLSRELKRRKTLLKSFENSQDPIPTLVAAADSFLIQRGETFRTLIAGYPWFGDWGRDTMISLPGLTLTTRRYEEARDILVSYATTCNQGLIPNYFPEYGETPEYNSVDASLWYIQAVQQYLSHTKDFDTVRQLYGILKEIVRYYREGTRYHIHMEEDGLIYAGEEGVQLTWMDVKIGNQLVTPRQGKAVEINALWYNVLKFMEELADEFRDAEGKEYKKLAQKVKKSFNDLFWNPEGEYLYDCIDEEFRDASIRPNQIFAISLPQALLNKEKGKKVVETVRKHLLTPYGLRSLAPTDEKYIGRYEGSPWERDKAYHQGTVWPWLIGPFIAAYLKIHGRSPKTRKTVSEWLNPFLTHLSEAGLGTISEVFDGDPPHTPRGCISQAWSVAEVLRVWYEELEEGH